MPSDPTYLNRLKSILAVAGLYAATAKLGFLVAIPPGNITAVWPASGIALAALLHFGLKCWPGVWLGSLAANFWFFAEQPHFTVWKEAWISLAIGAGSTLQACAGSIWIRHFLRGRDFLERPQDVFRFVGLAALSCVIAPIVGVTSLCAGQVSSWNTFAYSSWTWWTGDFIGMIIFTPFCLAWAQQFAHGWRRFRWMEGALVVLALVAAGAFIFGGGSALSTRHYPVASALVPFVIWAAMRLGQAGVSLAMVGVSLLSVLGTARGYGPFAFELGSTSLLWMQIFLGMLAVVGTSLAAAVAERNRTEVALREAEERTRLIVEGALDAVIIMDSGGMITGWNRQAESIFGWKRAEAIGRTLADTIIPARYRESHQRGMKHYLATGQGPVLNKRIEIEAIRRNGEEFPVELAISPFQSGGKISFGAFVRDITMRKQSQESIRKLNEELEMRVAQRTAELELSLKEMESFSYTISHDLRAPLRAMSGYSRILLDEHAGELSEKSRRCLSHIRRNAENMGRLIDDLLSLARFGRQPLSLRAVPVAALVREIIEELDHQKGERRVEWVLGALPSCHGDPVLLRQVFYNLIENAFKYSRDRSPARIEISGQLEEGKGEMIYCIQDNGVGFDMKYAHKIFGVFQRLHLPEEFEGTGVGLAIVERVMQRHGGRVWADAQPNQGATFYIALSQEKPHE